MNDVGKKPCALCNGTGEGQVGGKWCRRCCGKGYELSGNLKIVRIKFMGEELEMPAPVELTDEEALVIMHASLKALAERFLPPEEIKELKKFESN